MDKTVKNVLAVVGAVTLVKAAPVLAAGVAIGTVVANPEKVKKVVEDVVGKVEDLAARAEAAVEEELAKRSAEEECECCFGGKCDCEGECCYCAEGEPDEVAEDAGVPAEEESGSWEDEVPVEEEPAPAEADKMENLRSKAEEFLAALKSLTD